MSSSRVAELKLSFFTPAYEVIRRFTAIYNEENVAVIRVNMGMPFHLYFFRHPDHVQHILCDKETAATKPPQVMKRVKWIMGGGSFIQPGETNDWKHRRKMVDPLLKKKSCSTFCDTAVPVIGKTLQKWESMADTHKAVDIYTELNRMVVDLSFQSMFSYPLGERVNDVVEYTHFLEDQFQRTTPHWIPTPANCKFHKITREFQALMQDIIMRRREKSPSGLDSLSSIFNDVDPELGRKWTNKEIQDEMFSIFFGASAMAVPIVWTLVLLSQHPDVCRKLEEEVATILHGRFPTTEDFSHMPYMKMVIEESMRLYPPFWCSLRYAKEPHSFNGYQFPAKTIYVLMRYHTSRHPDFWANPEGFDPDRFAPDKVSSMHPFAVYPYGGGPRVCFGRNIAPRICALALAMILQKYTLHLNSRFPGDPVPRFGFGLYPENKVMMKIFHKRTSPSPSLQEPRRSGSCPFESLKHEENVRVDTSKPY